jgi:hypothetical protein
MQAWFEAGAADGFMISGAVLPDGLCDFIDHVLPILQSEVYFGPSTEPTHCAWQPGLPKPENRYAIAARQETANIHVTVSN